MWVLSAATAGVPARAGQAERAEVEQALAALKALRGQWEQFTAAGENGTVAAGEALTGVLGTSLEDTFQITIPEGGAVGVEVEGKSVVGVTRPSLGWQLADTIEQVNGEVAEDQDDLQKKIKAAKEKGGPIQLTVSRRRKSPFVTIEKALRLIYEDTSSPIPETDEVMAKVSSLKSKASLIVDGIGSLEDIRKKLDGLIADLEAFAASVPLAAGRVVQKKAIDNDLSELFGG